MYRKLAVLVLILSFPFLATASAQTVHYLPQVVNGQIAGGGSLRTTFVAFNTSDASVTVVIVLTRDDGTPLEVTIPGLGASSRFTLLLEAGSTRLLQTDGSGPATAGAATVTATGTIGVSAIFSTFDAAGNFLTEAGVGSSPPLTQFVIPADTTGTFNTGLALFNFGDSPATVSLRALDASSQERATGSVSIPGKGHLARFVSGPGEFFPALANFRGTLVVSSTGPVAALTLRQNSSPLSFTTLPVVARNSTQQQFTLPHIANGPFSGGVFRTSFLFFNISVARATVTLALTRDDGSPLTVNIPGLGSGSSFSLTLEAGASAFLQTDGSGALAAGAAIVTSSTPLGVSAIFTILDAQGRFLTEAGVGDSPIQSRLSMPVDITDQSDTGVAFLNRTAAAITLTLRLLAGDGILVATDTLTLPAGNRVARFVSELFPAAVSAAASRATDVAAGKPISPNLIAATRSFRGSLAVSSSGVVALTLRQNTSPLSFTTLPVAAGASSGRPPEPAPLLAQTVRAIDGTRDATVNITLPPGVRLSGEISGGGRPILVLARGADPAALFVGRLNSTANRYLVVVPADTYNVQVCYQPAASSTGVTGTHNEDPVQVPADTRRDIALPTVTASDVTGLIAGMGALPPLQNPSVSFATADSRSGGTLNLADNGTFQGRMPDGSYVGSLNGQARSGLTETQILSIYNIGTFTVAGGGTASLAVPAVARLSGTVRGPDVGSAFFLTMLAMDSSVPVDFRCAPLGGANVVSLFGPGEKSYRMVLAAGRTHNTSLSIPVTSGSGTEILGALNYPFPGREVALGGDMTVDFDVPALPPAVTIQGRVTDRAGNGVANVTIVLTSARITGVPNSSYAGVVQTDANGNFRTSVLSGTDYQLIATPPIPGP